MSKENSGPDPIHYSGNLRMSHVQSLLEKVIRTSVPDLTEQDDVGRKYGRVLWYSNQAGAANSSLNTEIVNFMNRCEPVPDDYMAVEGEVLDRSIGNNRVLVLLKVNSVMDVGTQNEQPNWQSDVSTHYTVLNLKRLENGSVVFSYSDSLQDNAPIPEVIRAALFQNGVALNNFQLFDSQQQGLNANCGYAAVFNALRMLEIPSPQPNFEEFVEVQRQILITEFGQLQDEMEVINPYNPIDCDMDILPVILDLTSPSQIPTREVKDIKIVEDLNLEINQQDLNNLISAIDDLRQLVNFDTEDIENDDIWLMRIVAPENQNFAANYLAGFCAKIRQLSVKEGNLISFYNHIPWNLIRDLDQFLDEIIAQPLNWQIINQDLRLLLSELEKIAVIQKVKNPQLLLQSASQEENQFLTQLFEGMKFNPDNYVLPLPNLKKESAQLFLKKYNQRLNDLVLKLDQIDLGNRFGIEAALEIIQIIGEQARNILLLSDIIDNPKYKSFLRNIKKLRDDLVHNYYDFNKDDPDKYSKFREFLKGRDSQDKIKAIIAYIKKNQIGQEQDIALLHPLSQQPEVLLTDQEVEDLMAIILESMPPNMRQNPLVGERLSVAKNLFLGKYLTPTTSGDFDKLFGYKDKEGKVFEGNLVKFIKGEIAGLKDWQGARQELKIKSTDSTEEKIRKPQQLKRYNQLTLKLRRGNPSEALEKEEVITDFEKKIALQPTSQGQGSLAVQSQIIADSLRSIGLLTRNLEVQGQAQKVAVRELVRQNTQYHYAILFHLNAIGAAIHNLTSRKEFIRIASLELKQEFARLRKIRNAIAHDYALGNSGSDLSYYGNDLLLNSIQIDAVRVFDSVQYLQSISTMISQTIEQMKAATVAGVDNSDYRQYELKELLKKALENDDQQLVSNLLYTFFVDELESCPDIFVFAQNYIEQNSPSPENQQLQKAINEQNNDACKELLLRVYQAKIQSHPAHYAKELLGVKTFLNIETLNQNQKAIEDLCRRYGVRILGISGEILEYSNTKDGQTGFLIEAKNADDVANFKREFRKLLGIDIKIFTEADLQEYCVRQNRSAEFDQIVGQIKKVSFASLLAGYRLYQAVENGNLDLVKRIVRNQQPFLDINVKGYGLLHIASMFWVRGYDQKTAKDICQVLLGAGANPNILDKHGNTFLHNAAESDELSLCVLAVEHKTNSAIKNSSGKTALDIAADLISEGEVYKYLLKQEKDSSKKLIAAIKKGSLKIVKSIVDNVDLNKKTESGELILNILCSSDCPEKIRIIEILIANGANIKAVDANGYNALDYALRNPDNQIFDLVKFLIDKNLPVDNQSIFQAIYCGDHRVVELLLEKGANVDAVDNGQTPVLRLVNTPAGLPWDEEAAILRTLINGGADLELQEEYVGNPLHMAAETGNMKAAEILLKAGLDKEIKSTASGSTFFGQTASQIARSKHHHQLAEMIDNYRHQPSQFPKQVARGFGAINLSTNTTVQPQSTWQDQVQESQNKKPRTK